MELFTLDSTYRRKDLIDEYESFIWTERYNEVGDFQLVVPPSLITKLYMGVMISHTDTDRIMTVEELNTTTTEQGIRMMTVKGKSWENVLKYRSINRRRWGAGLEGTLRQSGVLNNVVANLINYEVVEAHVGEANQYDGIPGLYYIGLADPSIETKTVVEPMALLDAIKEYCDPYDVGFRAQLMSDYRIRFSIYTGTVRENVIFSPQFDTLSNDSYVANRENYYTTAYVWAKDGMKVHGTNRRGVVSAGYGLQRRVLTVKTNVDVTKHTEEDVINDLTWYGWKALAKKNMTFAYDGEVTELNPFKYRRDYNLGDTVGLISSDMGGGRETVKVMEYIWVNDGNGFRSYPTFKDTGS